MKASYNIFKAPDNLGEQIHIVFLIDGKIDWDYERRVKAFYPMTPEGYKKAEQAGQRYLKKMKTNGFEV